MCLKMELTGFLMDCMWSEREGGLRDDSKTLILNFLLKWKCLKIGLSTHRDRAILVIHSQLET